MLHFLHSVPMFWEFRQDGWRTASRPTLDAINDPIMGSFPDRWRLGKSGDKFKPWIKLFMIPLALSGILCFYNVPFEGIALLHG
ncbi:MAG: MFS transporter [Clostridium sp.]